jgi:hypothetical protein
MRAKKTVTSSDAGWESNGETAQAASQRRNANDLNFAGPVACNPYSLNSRTALLAVFVFAMRSGKGSPFP